MFNKNLKSYNALGSHLKEVLAKNKWMFFIIALWILTYYTLETGMLTKRNTITVTGNSMNAVGNEIATFNVTVESRNAEKAAAVEDTNKRSSLIVEALKSFGIDGDDLQTAHMNVYQREEYVNDKYVKGDWSASVGIEITLRNVEKATSLSDLLASLDADNFYGPNFAVDRENLDESDLLEAAMEDALIKAHAVALGLDKKVGEVVHFQEGGASYGNIYPMYERADAGFGGGAPMEPGTTNISKTVTVTFELK